MKRYERKVCLVTASTAGIGYAIAERMALEHGNVIICSRNKENVENALAKMRANIGNAGSTGSVDGLEIDVGDKTQRKKLVDFID